MTKLHLLMTLLLSLRRVRSLHVFVSSESPHLITKHTFSLVLQGHDCPYNPCYFSIRNDKKVLATGQYENSTKSVDVIISKPGETKIMVIFSDNNAVSDLPYGSSLNDRLPLVFLLPVLVRKSDYCNSIAFFLSGKEVDGVLFSEDTLLEMKIFNGAREDITSQYFYSGVLSPAVQFSNSTSQFFLPISRNHTAETWTITLNESALLRQLEKNTSGTSQQDWKIRVAFPNTYMEACLVRESVFSVSLLSTLFVKPDRYFGAPVTPVINTESSLRSRYSPCSRNVQIVFQENSQYFGLYHYDSIQWFKVPDVGGKSSFLLDVVLLPAGIIFITSQGILTVGQGGRSERLLTTTHASVAATLTCPALGSDRTIITLNQNTVLSAEFPYTDWETLPITPDPNCKILDTYHDIIRDSTHVSQTCGNVVTVNGSGYGRPFQTKLTSLGKLSGVHWDAATSDLYLYGSQVLHSSSRGKSFSPVLTLSEGEFVSDMVSGGLLGDILALTESGRIFISNVGINRFVEVHNIHNTALRPHAYFTLDHTSQLSYHTLRNTSLSRYRIPRRALFATESMLGGKLYLEPVGGNRVRLISSSENDTFTKGDVGKIFQLNNDRGSGTVVEVSEIVLHGTTLSAAIVEVKEPFFKPKAVQNAIVIEPNGDGSVTIGSVGGVWRSGHLGSCIVVLYCTPFLVTGLHSQTSLIATPLYSDKATECMGLVESNRWFSINLDPYMSTVEVEIGDKFEVTEVGYQVTITTPSSLSSDLKGSIITVDGNRQGVVQEVGDRIITILSDAQFQLNEEFESGEIVFSSVGSGTLSEGMYPREPRWILSEPECRVAFVADDLSFLSHPVPEQSVHIDTKVQAELKVKVLDGRKFPPSPPVLRVMFDNRDKFLFYTNLNTTSHISQLTVGLSHTSVVSGTYTPVLITPYLTSSLRCEVPSVLFSVRQECDPQTRLVHQYTYLQDQKAFLSSLRVGPNGDNLMTSLPVNYRPPSIHGRDISVSPNVYNVDPSLPVSRSVKAVSKNSYHFKQCAGATTRSECTCSEELRISDLAAHSDCRQIVYTVPYTAAFTPNLLLVTFGAEPQPLNHTYLITEVNGREEYQTYRATENTLSPNCNYTNCSIVFLGSELFHFRVRVISDTICNYETEFLLFVVDVPLTKTFHNTITVHVGAIMFIIILIYYTSTKGNDSEKDFQRNDSAFKDDSSSSSSLTTTKNTPL